MSIESKMAEIGVEIRNLIQGMEEEKEKGNKDHDDIIKMKERIGTIKNRLDELKQFQSENTKSKDDDNKRFKSKVWQIIKLILAAIIGGAISKVT